MIDSDKYSEYIYQFWVTEMGVPTLLWFENGRKQFEYEQSRTSQDLLQFVKKYAFEHYLNISLPDFHVPFIALY